MIARSKQAQDFRGRIVNVASVAGLRATAQLGVYCMSKAAVVHMTRAQALEWGRYGINVNALCPVTYAPRSTKTTGIPMVGAADPDAAAPASRAAEDLDAPLLMLVADESQFINGAILTADDGLSVT